ncbi:MAG: hypothetical protein LBL62_02250 [Planctomycetaceae bacterium]|nr:hypothetical protein [Planctomycetaceae bacterium]
MLFSVLESMQTQPAQPPSGRIAHLFSPCLFLFSVGNRIAKRLAGFDWKR